MNIVYNYHEGSQAAMPELIDVTSSPTSVYLRKNVREICRKDEFSGEDVLFFGYEEAVLTRDEYNAYRDEAMFAAINEIKDSHLETNRLLKELHNIVSGID